MITIIILTGLIHFVNIARKETKYDAPQGVSKSGI